MPSKTFAGRFTSLEKIADFIAQAAQKAGFDSKSAYAIQLAVDEACSNIIEHGYAERENGKICCNYEVLENGLKIVIQDWGKSFNPNEVPKPNFEVALEDLKPRGAGLYFMKEIMDEVNFEFDNKDGNLLTMIKRK
ncbi:MAG TPA: ATP-binding protein [Chloroflexi bacterium]|nr:ATP-binding protein [Chloroflexota bacterium]HBY07286.1 ATP-binding protein [Chloroflexota bacterium]